MKILNQFIDLIYPPRCPICGDFHLDREADSEWLGFPVCRPCLDDFIEITHPCCSICRRPFESWVESDHPCEDCMRKWPFYRRVIVPYLYEGTLMSAIHQFKYEGKDFLSRSLGPLLSSFTSKELNGKKDLLVMPVPLHPKRLRERGFNQSLLLARYITAESDLDLDFLSLRRIRYTQPQIGLKKDERRKNVRKAFGLMHPKVVKGRTVLLVDDVTTTGNTLNECARILHRAGAKDIYCAVLARTAGI